MSGTVKITRNFRTGGPSSGAGVLSIADQTRATQRKAAAMNKIRTDPLADLLTSSVENLSLSPRPSPRLPAHFPVVRPPLA